MQKTKQIPSHRRNTKLRLDGKVLHVEKLEAIHVSAKFWHSSMLQRKEKMPLEEKHVMKRNKIISTNMSLLTENITIPRVKIQSNLSANDENTGSKNSLPITFTNEKRLRFLSFSFFVFT